MKPDFTYHRERVLNILRDETQSADEKEKLIREIFIEIELEFGYIDQKREEAEDEIRILFEAIKANKVENSENYLTPDV